MTDVKERPKPFHLLPRFAVSAAVLAVLKRRDPVVPAEHHSEPRRIGSKISGNVPHGPIGLGDLNFRPHQLQTMHQLARRLVEFFLELLNEVGRTHSHFLCNLHNTRIRLILSDDRQICFIQIHFFLKKLKLPIVRVFDGRQT